jgi:hypothetical protein
VVLSRSLGTGTAQVRVTTDPLSPAVGVNVGAVDQTVTFPNNQAKAVVRVPLLAGAPNPGEVDVNLTVTPVTPKVTISGPLELRILASDATIVPTIVSVQGKRRGIVLTFNKPMNPVEASNVNNYAVDWTSTHSKYDDLGPFSLLMPGSWPSGVSTTWGSVHLKAARYNPATNSVILITNGEINYSSLTSFTVSDGHKSNVGAGLTDLDGNSIDYFPGATPGYFSYPFSQGFQPTS